MNCFDYFFENTHDLNKELIVGNVESSSYQSVYKASIRLAGYLNKTVGRGKNIPLISPNSHFFIVAYLGILKSGNICIPLNPEIEQANFNYILDVTGAKIGFFSGTVLKKLEIPVDIISESNLSGIVTNQWPEEEIVSNFDGSQTAEIIFTSGSTATPKGVVLSHSNIISNADSIIQYLHLDENDRMLVVLPFFYCYGLSLLHTHLRVGGQLVLNNNFIFLTSTVKNLKDHQCTGFAGVPSHFQLLLRKIDLFRNSEFPSLRYVTQAGGKLHDTFIEEFTQLFPHVQFFVMYGQTEATARLSYLPPEKLKDKLGSLGKGIPGVELRVVDSRGNRVKPGKTGEIIAKGGNIMSGYFNDPEETAKVLRDGWLHTGDLARTDEDGYIYHVARKKEMIKVNGQRVSPKEIEGVIDMLPGVIDCSVDAVEDEFSTVAIRANIIISEEIHNLTEEDVQKFCATQLSKHKIPAIINLKRNISLSATGKKL